MSHHTGPVCSNTDCPCATPGPVCDQFEGYTKDFHPKPQLIGYCAACGWEEQDHKKEGGGDAP